ncbi:hypothetical protein [Actinocorallia longicatena]|uniref:PBP domain-containing protein n=1 Tax=Actinocorallia longicatena TaxID=111803 RepID=A0ABP6Q1R2_9ACTN
MRVLPAALAALAVAAALTCATTASADTTPTGAPAPAPSATLPTAAPTTPATPGPTPTGGATPTAPPGRPGNTKGKVTLDQSANLVNQVIRVSWSAFEPSSDGFLSDSTTHVVRVYQCRTKDPKAVSECYGSGKYTYESQAKGGTVLPDGPTNAITSITQPNGRGFADIEVRTLRESASLGCKGVRDCSVVVIPNDGDPARPELENQLATQANMDSDWAWANRIVVPISFSPSAAACALEDADFRISGSAPSRRLIEQWQPGLCTSKKPVDVDYTSLGESQARSGFQQKGTDVALTTRPDDAVPVRPFGYAPIGISGIAIAYRIDDIDTGKMITNLKLTPRLVAKLLTQSYGMSATCTVGVKDCNRAVKGNPQDIFQDPEFLKLNGEDHSWPSSGWPTVVSGDNDLAYELTRWLGEDPQTRQYLAGGAAPGGMRINKYYKGIRYPAGNFEIRDPDKRFAHGFIPVLGLSEVARFLVTNRDNSENYVKDQYGNYVKTAPYAVGNRGLIAIVSTADAAALRFPTAKIKNAAGKFVAPSDASMTAMLRHLKKNKDGVTQSPDYTARDAKAYPLTGVHYAQVPTSGIEPVKARKIADFLAHVAGKGQKQGVSPGTRPVGYVALTPAMRQQTRKAAKDVLAQKGKLPATATPPPPATPGPDDPGPVTLPTIPGALPAPMGGRLSADAASLLGWLLPALLALGVAAGLIGPGLYGAGRFGLKAPPLRRPVIVPGAWKPAAFRNKSGKRRK